MIPDAWKVKNTGKAAMLALAQLAAIGCTALPDASAGRAVTAGGAAVAVQALEQEQFSRLYAALPPTDPIAATGHGMIITSDGRTIKPTPEFVRSTQLFYIDRLFYEASPSVQQEYLREQPNWEPAPGEEREFSRRGGIIDWFLQQVRPADFDKLDARNRYLVYAMEPQDAAFVERGDTRQSYWDECRDAFVPSPPNWGPDPARLGWTWGGPLDKTDFLDSGPATVWYMISSDPERPGLCIALPRVQSYEVQETTAAGETVSRTEQVIGLLGVICQGKRTNQVCFWDDDDADPIEFPTLRERDIKKDFKSAADLAASGDVCTTCHRGENVYIIHPETNLDIDYLRQPASWKFNKSESYLRASDWISPIVVPEVRWPKNEKWTQAEKDALNAVPLVDVGGLPETDCMDCHFEGGEGGGLGRLDDTDYCSSVILKALDPVTGTMPPKYYLEGTGKWAGKKHAPSKGHLEFFLDKCNTVIKNHPETR